MFCRERFDPFSQLIYTRYFPIIVLFISLFSLIFILHSVSMNSSYLLLSPLQHTQLHVSISYFTFVSSLSLNGLVLIFTRCTCQSEHALTIIQEFEYTWRVSIRFLLLCCLRYRIFWCLFSQCTCECLIYLIFAINKIY